MEVQAQIKGIKESYIRDLNSGTSWKDLIDVAKNNPQEYSSDINSETVSKYFEPNTHIIIDALDKQTNFRVCKGCGKPILLEAIVDHIENHCSNSRDQKEGTVGDMDSFSESLINSPTNGSIDGSLQTKENLKRSLDNESSDIMSSPGKQDAKKMKSETPGNSNRKPKKVKQRNPTDKHLIDFDKQCGVKLPEGGYCARSLTCKSHSMGDKRSVVGRTEPFDTLLAEYHRKHQTKIGAAAEKRAKQQEMQKMQKQTQRDHKDQKKTTQTKTDKRKKASTTTNKTVRGTGSNRGKNSSTQNTMNYPVLTPEEETTQVLNGVSRSFPLPLESRVLSSVRYRTKYVRMREMFASAFSVKPGFSNPGYGAIHSRVGCIDIDRTTDYKYRIRTPQPVNQQGTQNLTPQQIQKMQQQRMIQNQMLQQKQAQNAQQMGFNNNNNNNQNIGSPGANMVNSPSINNQDQLLRQTKQTNSNDLNHIGGQHPIPNVQGPSSPENNLINGVGVGSPVNNPQSPGMGNLQMGTQMVGKDSSPSQFGGRVN